MSSMPTLFSYGFRAFFLSCALYAIAIMIGWAGVFTLGWTNGGINPVAWHAHEMLFGFATAAIAGFLLTAVPNWTGTERIQGAGLLSLWLIWLSGRVGYWLIDPAGASVGAWIVMLVDLAFVPALALAIGLPIFRSGNRRNLIVIGVLAALSAANLLYYTGSSIVRANTLALDLIVVLMMVISGRITPLFTRNWMNREGLNGDSVQSHRWLDVVSIALMIVLAILVQLEMPLRLTGWLAIFTALVHAVRLTRWQGWRAWSDSIVWVLHLGYAWIVVSLALRGIGSLVATIPNNAWVHAAGVGAMATLILGVMARVSLGHTGRVIRMPVGGWLIFVLITVAAIVRTGTAAGWLAREPWLWVAAAAWIAAFLHFVFIFFGTLVSPRIDNRPG